MQYIADANERNDAQACDLDEVIFFVVLLCAKLLAILRNSFNDETQAMSIFELFSLVPSKAEIHVFFSG